MSTVAISLTPVCAVDTIPIEGGVAALVAGSAVAVFRSFDGEVFALANVDPFSGASVLSRGIVGTRGDAPVVSSPMYKQAFDLRTGACLDDAAARVPAYVVAVVDGVVQVGPTREVA
jgi:nitrite reductase (NADH) small subunit